MDIAEGLIHLRGGASEHDKFRVRITEMPFRQGVNTVHKGIVFNDSWLRLLSLYTRAVDSPYQKY